MPDHHITIRVGKLIEGSAEGPAAVGLLCALVVLRLGVRLATVALVCWALGLGP